MAFWLIFLHSCSSSKLFYTIFHSHCCCPGHTSHPLATVCQSTSQYRRIVYMSLSPSGWFRSLSHTGSPSPLGSILHVHQGDSQVLHVVLHDVDDRSIFFSVFPYSVVHIRLPPRFSWHNPPLLGVVHAQTISTWPPVLCPWCTLLRECDGYRHFLFLSLNVRPRIHLSILISVLSKRSSSRLFNVHVYEP